MAEQSETIAPGRVHYSDELAARICARRAAGEPLVKICKDADMPNAATVYAWIRERPAFREVYEVAQQDLAHTLADEIVSIADDAPLVVEVEGQRIDVKIDMAAVQRNRLRVDARKWVASKLMPRKFGDQLAIGGASELPPVALDGSAFLDGARRIAFILARAAQLNERSPAPLALLTNGPATVIRST